MGPSRRTFIGGIGGAAASAALSACGSGADPNTFIIGATATGAPFSFIDTQSGELTGAMVDIAKAVAANMGIDARVDTLAFAALIPSLATRKIDVIAAAMLRTPEREQVVSFSDPVYAYGGAVVWRSGGARPCAALSDLAATKVGVQIGTRFVDQLLAAGVRDVTTYDNLSDSLRDLSNGRVDAVYADEPILSHRLRTENAAPFEFASDFVAPSAEEVCLVMRKDDNVRLARVNQAIAALLLGEIPSILARWGL